MSRTILLLIGLYCGVLSVYSADIVPKPLKIRETRALYALQEGMTISYNSKSIQPAAEYLKEILEPATGYNFRLSKKKGDISLILLSDKDQKDESYTLSITVEGITIQSRSYKGIIHGISSLRQVMPEEIESRTLVKGIKWYIPTLYVEDNPQYEWRGLMLDPVRHFYTIEETKRLIDVMALFKFSKFHWHLIDSQGWRIEIKKYPLLTQKGAWRNPDIEPIDKECESRAERFQDPSMKLPADRIKTINGQRVYGGYYTQKEIKDIIKYAAIRGIDVVPELDMPGHNLMATQCYPWLSCQHSGHDPLCLGNDSTLTFCKNVYKEVFKLFPYQYVEIGGDEVNRSRWEKCPLCQQRVKDENLKNMAELQSWFTRNMEFFFNRHGRRLIGWDEILEGGVSKTATVNWWQGYHKDVVQKATDGGNEVIVCPTTYCYFDYAVDSTTMKKMYIEGIVPSGLTPSQKSLVKGIQGNIWCEYIPSEERMQYMIFPRALALAEKAWTPDTHQDWNDFLQRLQSQLRRLDAMGIKYRPMDAQFTPGFNKVQP